MFGTVFKLRSSSLLRANFIVLGSLFAAFILAHFPQNRPSPLLIVPALAALYGTYETLRCLKMRWSMYHAGVMLCVYMDILSVTMILFLLLYPYMQWAS